MIAQGSFALVVLVLDCCKTTQGDEEIIVQIGPLVWVNFWPNHPARDLRKNNA